MTIDKLNKDFCSGCLACYNVCPQNAISLIINFEGFFEPRVNFQKCIDCGLCTSACSRMNNVCLNQVKESHAIICEDEIRDSCSSGGAWGIFAYHVKRANGIVYGAVFDQEYKRVRHRRLEKIDEICKSFGSKYLQSDIDFTYKNVRDDLKTGRLVIFSGCPCQVDALKKYLHVDYDNLITVDILCHGVASPWAYKKFLDEFIADIDDPIIKSSFRDKTYGWACNVVVDTEDGTKRVSSHSGDYFNAFLWGYSVRNACFSCPYANADRVGDLSIGDFWEIKKVFSDWNDYRGTSLLLINTDKGKKFYSEVKCEIKKDIICDYSDVVNKTGDVNWAIVKPGKKPISKDVFFYRLHRGDEFSEAFKYASTGRFDVGIFGWWFEDNWTNYGSTLTYYSLLEYVSSLGLSVCMIPSPFHRAENASEFVKSHGYRIADTHSFGDFYKHNANINKFLIGSDQLWFYDCYKSWGHSLFLDFVSNDKKKIAYATSFGHADPKIPNDEKIQIKKLLDRFDGISTREISGVEYLAKEININAVQVLDPVFLVDDAVWDDLQEDAQRKTTGEYIFAYILDPNDEKIKILNEMKEKLGISIISITDHQYDRKNKEQMLCNNGIIREASIYELIYHLKNAKYVITDSFHGTCFSLIFNKNFISLVNPKRGSTRFDTLAEIAKISDRFVYDIKNFKLNDNILMKPNYYEISKILKKEIQRSKTWLNYQLLS